MLGTKLLYGKYSTKNVAYNGRRNVRFIAYSILRMREIGRWEGKLDFLKVAATERIFKLLKPGLLMADAYSKPGSVVNRGAGTIGGRRRGGRELGCDVLARART